MSLLPGNASDHWRSLCNGNTAELQSAPGGHAHAANSQCGAETPAQFLLNLCVGTLRLHIKVYAGQEDRTKRKHCSQSNQRNPAQFFHRETLRSPSLKKRPKPSATFLS